MGEGEKPYHPALRFEFVEDSFNKNNFTKPVLSYGEIMKYNKLETKFLPAEDPPKKIRLGKVDPGTLKDINEKASLKYNDGNTTSGVGGQVL